jgi:hypothetical protein
MKSRLFLTFATILFSTSAFGAKTSFFDLAPVSKDLVTRQLVQKHFTGGQVDSPKAIVKIDELIALLEQFRKGAKEDEGEVTQQAWDFCMSWILEPLVMPVDPLIENSELAQIAIAVSGAAARNLVAYQLDQLKIEDALIEPYRSFFKAGPFSPENETQMRALGKMILTQLNKKKMSDRVDIMLDGALEALQTFKADLK